VQTDHLEEIPQNQRLYGAMAAEEGEAFAAEPPVQTLE
jgi:hypothetical protein